MASNPRKPSVSGLAKPAISKNFIGAVEDEWQLYSDRPSDYTVGLPIGFGASSIVYTAKYHGSESPEGSAPASPIPVALKVLDLDKLPVHSLSLLQRETTLMSLSKHPNVIRVRGSWIDGHHLYIAMRLMNKGSVADIMRYGWPGGMEEDVCRCILYQGLQGLNYLHINGFIHRDIKAANFLIDDDGTVLLGDLGVAANLADDSSHGSSAHHTRSHNISSASAVAESSGTHTRPEHNRENSSTSLSKRVVLVETPVPPRPNLIKRKSFVGTPCWMAPELIQGKQYDASADIWSFGITALELTLGRPPRSRESPQKVLLRTIQEDPPTLDREGGTYKYSRAFKEMIDSCLVKDPAQRPTAEELLQMPFFRNVKKKSYLVNTVLKDLPPLTARQERRALHSTLIHPSVASWDFATTIHSKSPTVTSRRSKSTSTAEESPVVSRDDESFDLETPLGSAAISRRPVSFLTSTQPKDLTSVVDDGAMNRPDSTSPTDEGSSSAVTSDSENARSDSDSPPTSESEPAGDGYGKASLPGASSAPIPLPGKSVGSPPNATHQEISSSLSSLSSLGASAPSSGVSSSPSAQSGLWNKLKNKAKRNPDSDSSMSLRRIASATKAKMR